MKVSNGTESANLQRPFLEVLFVGMQYGMQQSDARDRVATSGSAAIQFAL